MAGALTNSGFLGLDNYYAGGGSTLSIGGALTNTGTLDGRQLRRPRRWTR